MVGWKNHEARSGWTDADEELLRQLVKVDGLSAAQCVERFAGRFSRNAIIGKVGRMREGNGKVPAEPAMMFANTPGHGMPKTPGPRRPRKPRVTVAGVSAPPKDGKRAGGAASALPAAVMAPALEWKPPAKTPRDGVTVLDRQSWQCKWPTHSPPASPTFRMCGAPRHGWAAHATDETALPYCTDHCFLAWQGNGWMDRAA